VISSDDERRELESLGFREFAHLDIDSTLRCAVLVSFGAFDTPEPLPIARLLELLGFNDDTNVNGRFS
jgi:hypothetical protein